MMQRRKVGGEFKLKAVKPTPRRDTKSDIYKKMYGAAYRTRTCDPRITNAMLYQLS